MKKVFDKNIKATELLLNVILERADLQVLESSGQREFSNPVHDGHSITLDIYAKTSDGKELDVEIQRDDKGADAHRARFHSSMLDARMLKAGQKFCELHDSYVIFITENDVMGEGYPIYNADRYIEQSGKPLNDGSHIIYVNGAYENDKTEIGKLMHDFRCKDYKDMYNPILADSVKHFKESEGGKDSMCKAVEELVERRAEERAKEIAKERAKEIAREMMKDGNLSSEKIAQYCGLSLEIVENLNDK